MQTTADAANLCEDRLASIDGFGFKIKKGQQALFAIHLHANPEFNVFLIAKWDHNNSTPTVDLENSFLPSGNRLGQIYYHNLGQTKTSCYALMVEINGLFYTSSQFADLEGENKKTNAKFRYVPNGGQLICQYILGEIGPEKIVEAVKEKESDKSSQEKLKEALKKIDILSEKVEHKNETLKTLMARLESSVKVLSLMTDTMREVSPFTKAYYKTYKLASEALNQSYFFEISKKVLLKKIISLRPKTELEIMIEEAVSESSKVFERLSDEERKAFTEALDEIIGLSETE